MQLDGIARLVSEGRVDLHTVDVAQHGKGALVRDDSVIGSRDDLPRRLAGRRNGRSKCNGRNRERRRDTGPTCELFHGPIVRRPPPRTMRPPSIPALPHGKATLTVRQGPNRLGLPARTAADVLEPQPGVRNRSPGAPDKQRRAAGIGRIKWTWSDGLARDRERPPTALLGGATRSFSAAETCRAFMTAPRTRAMFGTPRRCGRWDGRHSSSGATTSLASNRSLAESASTRCGACASTGSSRSVVSAAAATLISRGRPSCCDTSTVKG